MLLEETFRWQQLHNFRLPIVLRSFQGRPANANRLKTLLRSL
jgi:hypothetical protein